MNLFDYFKEGRWTNRFAMIPMTYRNDPQVLAVLKAGGRVRYRGPRRKVTWPGSYYFGKTSFEGQSTCLKEDATHFTLYM